MSRSPTEDMISEFIDKSKEPGLKVTPQRIAVYRELAGKCEHPSTETIYRSIKRRHPGISLTTVYRTLETFEKTGLVPVVNTLYHAAGYDANLEPHHHVVCTECEKIEDLYEDSMNHSKLNETRIENYRILGYSVLFSGICEKCRNPDC